MQTTTIAQEADLFKNSEFNLDEKEELSDKDYYDKDGLMK